jgi:hypothetical protein
MVTSGRLPTMECSFCRSLCRPLDGGEVFADHRHPEIGAVLAAVAFRNRKTQMTGAIGKVFHPAQQRFPFVPWQPAIVEIGARPFASVIEKADVVVGLLDRPDLFRDEMIQFGKVGNEIGGQRKIQGDSPGCRFLVSLDRLR